MFKELKIGAKKVSFLSNGVTPLFYKQIFKGDLLKSLNTGEQFEIASDKIPELAFIMAKQAESITPADMMKLSINEYIEWLSQFEPLDLTMCGSEIVGVYLSDSVPTEEPKKKVSGKASA